MLACQHTDLINVRLDQCRCCLDSLFQKLAAGIQDHRFSGVFHNLHEALVGTSVKSLRHAAGHRHNRSVFYKLAEFFLKALKICLCQCKSRLQEFGLYMIHLIPDVDTGAALRIYMVKSTLNTKGFQGSFYIIACVAAYKAGGNHFGTVNGRRLGNIQSLSAGNIGTFTHPVHFAHLKIIHYITLVNGSV